MTRAMEPEPQREPAAEPETGTPVMVEDDPLIHWEPTREDELLMLAADRSLRSALRRLNEPSGWWVSWMVIVRHDDDGSVYYYAYRPLELREAATASPERLDWPLQQALDLHEWGSSMQGRGRRPLGAPHPPSPSPATGRIVDFDAAGRITAVGEYRDRFPDGVVIVTGDAGGTITIARPSSTRPRPFIIPDDDSASNLESFDLGPMRGGHTLPTAEPAEPAEPLDFSVPRRSVDVGEPAEPASLPQSEPGWATAAPTPMAPAPGAPVGAGPGEPAEIEITLSAETKPEINVEAKQRVDFRLELADEAMPLAVVLAGPAVHAKVAPIVVSLSVEQDALAIIGPREITVQPPARGQPTSGNFAVQGAKAGVTRLAVTFRQGGSDLGVIALAIEVLASGAKAGTTQGRATAAPTDPADDDKLALLIEQRNENGKLFYNYELHCEALNVHYERFDSKPLLDRGDGPAKSAQAFVERIYERVTQKLKSFDDVKELQREARALGATLSRELFDPDVARRLWPLRDRIKLIQIRSWEPYIPWELVRLHDPDTDETDARFLAEYNLVRTLTDRPPARRLALRDWSYLAATFPMGSLPSVGAELGYFTGAGPQSLQAHAITPTAVDATKDAFYDVLAEGKFDVLHISCHAESQHDSIEKASLVIGDMTPPGASRPALIQVNTETVRNEAKLAARAPLVFLNACETGRVGAVLTAWGGWPNVFVRCGAGAFVGASWAVRDKPAAAFATAFYEALWNDKTLAEAAGAARQAAKASGDASWLAYKVYGHPRARRAT
jgi:hypothetical protein